MTTKQIIEADETGRLAQNTCGQAGALIRGLQAQGLFTRKKFGRDAFNAPTDRELRPHLSEIIMYQRVKPRLR